MSLESFIKEVDLIPETKIHNINNIWEYIWDDYNKLNDFLSQNKGKFIYTIVTEGNDDYLYEGKRFINRMGYIVANNYIKLEDGVLEL